MEAKRHTTPRLLRNLRGGGAQSGRRTRASKYLIFDAPIASQKGSSVSLSLYSCEVSSTCRLFSPLESSPPSASVLPTAGGGVSPTSTPTPPKLKSPLDSRRLKCTSIARSMQWLYFSSVNKPRLLLSVDTRHVTLGAYYTEGRPNGDRHSIQAWVTRPFTVIHCSARRDVRPIHLSPCLVGLVITWMDAVFSKSSAGGAAGRSVGRRSPALRNGLGAPCLLPSPGAVVSIFRHVFPMLGAAGRGRGRASI